jgi:serine O-acetyltransferase
MNVKRIVLKIRLLISSLWLIPHIVVMRCHPQRQIIELDIEKWSIERVSCLAMIKKPDSALGRMFTFVQLMTYYPEYRSVFYYRLGLIGKLLSPLYSPMPTLYIYTKDIGPGLFIQHGFATIISARKIGRNCSINQQVTIGFSNDTDCPTIGDNVIINAGAKVIGNVTVGDKALVGANAVVVKDVPENCTVVGVPAYIVRRNGMKVKEHL